MEQPKETIIKALMDTIVKVGIPTFLFIFIFLTILDSFRKPTKKIKEEHKSTSYK